MKIEQILDEAIAGFTDNPLSDADTIKKPRNPIQMTPKSDPLLRRLPDGRLVTQRGFQPYAEPLPLDAGIKSLIAAGWGANYANASADKVFVNDASGEETTKLLQRCAGAFYSYNTSGVYFAGALGAGKTSVMALIARYAVRNFRVSPLLAQAYDLSALTFDDRYKFKIYKHAPLLFVDDLTRSRQTDFIMEIWDEIFEYRHSHNLLTYVTANVSVADLRNKQGWNRIASLLSDKRFISEYHFVSQDRRRLSE